MMTLLFPESEIRQIMDNVSTPGNISTKKKNQVIYLETQGSPACLLLHEGTISLLRNSDNMLLTMVNAPMLLNMNLYKTSSDFYCRVEIDSRYELMPIQELEDKFESLNMWRSVARFHMYITARANQYISNMMAVDPKSITIYCLRLLQRESPYIKERRTAADYIINKSNLSRTTVVKILTVLKKSGGLVTRKGLLISFDETREY